MPRMFDHIGPMQGNIPLMFDCMRPMQDNMPRMFGNMRAETHRVLMVPCGSAATPPDMVTELPSLAKEVCHAYALYVWDGGRSLTQATGLPHLWPMRTSQRWISDFLNLFFPNADEPEALWPWVKIVAVLVLCGVLGVLYATI